jgi:CRP/FNR family transcriptional regulator
MVLTATAARPGPRSAFALARGAASSNSSDYVGIRVLATNEELFTIGEPKTDLYLVESGVLALYEPRWIGHEAIIEFAFAGDLVGLGFLHTHTCSARASVETLVHRLPFSGQDQLIADDPRAQARLADAIEREFEFLRKSAVKFSRENPLGRLAAFLLTLSRQNEQEGRDPAALTQPLQCGVVADFLALSIERLGSLLVQLNQRGIIEDAASGGLRLADVAALEKLAGGTRLRDSKDPIERDVLTLGTEREKVRLSSDMAARLSDSTDQGEQ